MIYEASVDFDDYDEETLATKCTECNAAVGGKCLAPKQGGMGGMIWLKSPHRSRVLAAHERKEESIWGGP